MSSSTKKIERPWGLWQKENESINDYAIRLCREINELAGVTN